MRPADIKCRLCGIDYAKSEGCATCQPAKRNIDWPGIHEQPIDLLKLSQKGIRLIEVNLDRLEREMMESVGGRSGHYYKEHAKEAAMLNRSLAFVIAEARKLEERDEKKVENMSFSEKVQLFLDFIAELPEEHQRQVAERVVGLLGPGDEAEVVS